MPELNEALKERNPNGTLSFEKIADEKTVTYSSAAWVWRKLYLEANVNYDRTFGDHRLGGLLFYYIEDTSETGADKSMNAIPKRYQIKSAKRKNRFSKTKLKSQVGKSPKRKRLVSRHTHKNRTAFERLSNGIQTLFFLCKKDSKKHCQFSKNSYLYIVLERVFTLAILSHN